MLLICAAMEEELRMAMDLFGNAEKAHAQNIKLWRASSENETICFLKNGVGPNRAAERLDNALSLIKPSRILVIGYAGGIDPELKIGSLVAIRKASLFRMDPDRPGWEQVKLDGDFELTDYESLAKSAESVGLSAKIGDALTSSYVLGDPAHKRILREKFQASIVDMETAALARMAARHATSISCIRVISDVAEDNFLAPFSYDPAVGVPSRVKTFFSNGMGETYKKWKDSSAIAGDSMRRFIRNYLMRHDD